MKNKKLSSDTTRKRNSVRGNSNSRERVHRSSLVRDVGTNLPPFFDKKHSPSTDPENPEWTEEDIANARPGAEVFAELGIELPKPKGRPRAQNPKQQITIRLDADILEAFRATGRGWHTRLNDLLKKHMDEIT